MKKFIAIAVCLLLLVTIVAVSWRSGPSSPPPHGAVRLLFAGYTNDAVGTRLARFTVSNGAPVTIRRLAVVRIDSQRQYTNPSKVSIAGPVLSLAPGQAESILLPVPTNDSLWKVDIFCSRDGWRRRSWELAGRWRSGPAWLHQALRMEYSTSSEWIDP